MNQKEQNILETCVAATYDMLVGNWDGIMALLEAGHHKKVCINLTLDVSSIVEIPTVAPQISYRTRSFSSAQPTRAVDPNQSEFRFTSGLVSSPASHLNRIRRIAAV